MIKINRHIEIVRSSKRGLSSLSEVSSNAIFDVLSRNYVRVGVTTVNNIQDLELLRTRAPDLVFLGMNYVPDETKHNAESQEKVWISRYLDDYGIAYTGSDQDAHMLEVNKTFAKDRILQAGLMTSKYYVAKQGHKHPITETNLNFPVFIKPISRGGGLGVDSDSVAHTADQVNQKVKSIADTYQSDALIEEYLSGREFSVAVMKDEFSDTYKAMPIELVAPPNARGVRMLGHEMKSSNLEQVHAISDTHVRTAVNTLAIEVFHALGARDYGRIDIRMDAHGIPHFLEANLLPSLIAGYGSFPKACVLNANVAYEPMILQIVRLGLSRRKEREEKILKPLFLKLDSILTAA